MFNLSKPFLGKSGMENIITEYIARKLHIAVNTIAINCSLSIYIHLCAFVILFVDNSKDRI